MPKRISNSEIYLTLQTLFTEAVRDPLWGHIYLSPAIKELLSTPAMHKLSKIKQLGPTHFLYPGAVHTRLSHSLGVFEIGKKVIEKMLLCENCPSLTLSGVQSFLVACLLHDTGHFPYAHSLKELPLKEHEAITAELILQEPIASIINDRIQGDALMAAAIVDKNRPVEAQSEASFYRHILSGVLDPDKLDYLNRDAFFCGIPYGIQDIDFVIDNIVPDPDFGIAIRPKGIEAIENILFSKYLMYKSVYWHKTVRIATAMIKKSIILGLNDKSILPEDLYLLDDDEFVSRYTQSSYSHHQLVCATETRQFYLPVIEWNYDKTNHFDQQLSNLNFRLKFEKKLSSELGLSEEDLIIDIPEPISFETDLRIYQDHSFIPFKEGMSVFNPTVIDNFQNSLRKVRVLLNPDFIESTDITSKLQSALNLNHANHQ